MIILAVLILAAISGCVILCFTFSSEEVGLARIAVGMQASLAGITSVALAFFVAGPTITVPMGRHAGTRTARKV